MGKSGTDRVRDAESDMRSTCRMIAVAVALLTPSLAAAEDVATETEKARAAIQRKDFSGARDIYRQLAVHEPDNVAFLVWIGRLSRWLDDVRAATAALDHALALAPRDVDALVEKASVLMSQRDFSGANQLLIRADAVAPDSSDVQLAWARYYRDVRRENDARVYVKRVLAREPANKEALDLAAQLRPAEALEVRVGYAYDDFSFAAAGTAGSLTVGYTADRWRAAVLGEHWKRFGESVNRGGFTAARRFGKQLTLRGGAIWTPRATVLPRRDYSAGASIAWSRRVVSVDYRALHFDAATVQILAPSLEYYFKRSAWLTGTIYGSRTKLANSDRVDDRSAFFARYFHQVSPSWIFNAGYGRGSETSDLSIDRLAKFDANTYIAGATWKPSGSIAIDSHYARQDRSNGTHVNSFGLSVAFRKSN